MASLFSGGLLAAAAFGMRVWAANSFSLSWAAEEMKTINKLNAVQQYGWTSIVEKMQAQQRLGGSRPPSVLPAVSEAGILVWKDDILQSLRRFRLAGLFAWTQIFAAMFDFPILPDFNCRVLVIGV